MARSRERRRRRRTRNPSARDIRRVPVAFRSSTTSRPRRGRGKRRASHAGARAPADAHAGGRRVHRAAKRGWLLQKKEFVVGFQPISDARRPERCQRRSTHETYKRIHSSRAHERACPTPRTIAFSARHDPPPDGRPPREATEKHHFSKKHAFHHASLAGFFAEAHLRDLVQELGAPVVALRLGAGAFPVRIAISASSTSRALPCARSPRQARRPVRRGGHQRRELVLRRVSGRNDTDSSFEVTAASVPPPPPFVASAFCARRRRVPPAVRAARHPRREQRKLAIIPHHRPPSRPRSPEVDVRQNAFVSKGAQRTPSKSIASIGAQDVLDERVERAAARARRSGIRRRSTDVFFLEKERVRIFFRNWWNDFRVRSRG